MNRKNPVHLDHVSRTYRRDDFEVRALDDVTLKIPEHGFVAIMGPSESGKTTMLKRQLSGGQEQRTAIARAIVADPTIVRTAAVGLKLRNGSLEASVADTGRGFSPALLKEIQASSGLAGGVGIPGMRERIGYGGGRVEILSSEHGATITAALPIEYRSVSWGEDQQRGWLHG
jgi:glucose-6-phosphate-specific signal transduction histidine kinase